MFDLLAYLNETPKYASSTAKPDLVALADGKAWAKSS